MIMKRKKKALQAPKLESLKQINPNAAGVDVGASELYVCVPEDRDPRPVRVFQTFTSDLHEIAAWLKKCRVTSVAMESTGIYWIPLYEVLEEAGFEVKLVNAREAKNMPGRKSDILDCQWIQQLHSYGLLTASFRPPRDIVALRSLVRHRDRLIVARAVHIQHMQKALHLMNLQLDVGGGQKGYQSGGGKGATLPSGRCELSTYRRKTSLFLPPCLWTLFGPAKMVLFQPPLTPWKIYIVSADGGSPQQAMPGEHNEADPTWSPDGNSIAFGWMIVLE